MSDALHVFTTVGTDHHPFDRLVGWMQQWHRANPDVTGVVQYGTSRVPDLPEGVVGSDYVTYEQMVAAFARADAVVCHGGPATIMDARYAGVLPIVLPRAHAHGEHVDDHQVRFTQRLAELGQVVLVEDDDDLATVLEKLRVDREAFVLQAEADATRDAVVAFARQVRALGPGGVDPTPPPARGSLADRARAAVRRRGLRA